MRLFLILLILIYASVCDIRTMEVPDICFIAIIIVGISSDFLQGLFGFAIIAAAYIIFVLLVSLLGKEVPIGMADAKIFASLAFALGLYSSFLIFCYANIASGIFAIFLLLKHKAKDFAFPFVPFITLGMLYFLIQQQLQNI